mmetsp:Transcript_4420/g.14174  ORF Transcript_4420/g.14174 Transcript_4420/m.14174 type:complete len:293 (+) Transcript_4420:139-1017(+)
MHARTHAPSLAGREGRTLRGLAANLGVRRLRPLAELREEWAVRLLVGYGLRALRGPEEEEEAGEAEVGVADHQAEHGRQQRHEPVPLLGQRAHHEAVEAAKLEALLEAVAAEERGDVARVVHLPREHGGVRPHVAHGVGVEDLLAAPAVRPQQRVQDHRVGQEGRKAEQVQGPHLAAALKLRGQHLLDLVARHHAHEAELQGSDDRNNPDGVVGGCPVDDQAVCSGVADEDRRKQRDNVAQGQADVVRQEDVPEPVRDVEDRLRADEVQDRGEHEGKEPLPGHNVQQLRSVA